jgi:transcriptional regulator with XRE-family HTH domain
VFARMLGVGQAAVSKFEKGKGFPSIEVLLKLKEYSGRSIDWIRGRTHRSRHERGVLL